MANNYTQFSAFLKVKNKAQSLWLAKELSSPFEWPEYHLLETKYPDEEEFTEMRDAWLGEWAEERHEDPSEAHELAERWPDFGVSWTADGLIFFSEECGNIDAVIDLVHRFLKKFKRKDAFILTWADTCSKLRPDEFGGGFGIATAEETYINNTAYLSAQWLRERGKKRKI